MQRTRDPLVGRERIWELPPRDEERSGSLREGDRPSEGP